MCKAAIICARPGTLSANGIGVPNAWTNGVCVCLCVCVCVNYYRRSIGSNVLKRYARAESKVPGNQIEKHQRGEKKIFFNFISDSGGLIVIDYTLRYPSPPSHYTWVSVTRVRTEESPAGRHSAIRSESCESVLATAVLDGLRAVR